MIASPTTEYQAEEPYGPPDATPATPRQATLAAAVAGIRTRRSRLAVEQILLVAGTVLFPLGLVLILLGWEGAAHNGHTYAQIDYLISGGIFGLGLSVAGGFMYFGYWLSRQLAESRRQNAATVQALHRLEDLFDFALTSRPAAAAGSPTGPVPVVGAATLFATPRGTLLHRPDCPVVARRDDLRAIAAGTDGYGYCTMCNAAAGSRESSR